MGPKKIGCRGKAEKGVVSREVGLRIILVGIHQKEGGPTLAWIERKRPVLGLALHLNQSFYLACTAAGTKRKEKNQMARLSA